MKPNMSTTGRVAAAVGLSVSLGVLAAVLFLAEEKMPMTVLGFGLLAIGSAVKLCEEFIDRSPQDIKKHLP
jgi:uncharacterized membrane protein